MILQATWCGQKQTNKQPPKKQMPGFLGRERMEAVGSQTGGKVMGCFFKKVNSFSCIKT